MSAPDPPFTAGPPEGPLPALPGAFRVRWERAGAAPVVEAHDPAGRAYGEDWAARLPAAERPGVPGYHQAVPRFAERGLLLDCSRNRVPRRESLTRLIADLRRLRYNRLLLYTEHTYAYPSHREVWEGHSPLQPAEIRELEEECRGHHIELVPCTNTFGHMERWLRHDRYHALAESPGGFVHPHTGRSTGSSTLRPGRESLALVESLLGELLAGFSAPAVHIGGDEPWELGEGRSREEVERRGKAAVYLDFLRSILSVARAHGRTPLFWADVVLSSPETVARLPADCHPTLWGYEPGHPFERECALVAAAGFAGNYTIVPGSGTWNSLTGRLVACAANLAEATVAGERHGARGLLLAAWGDNGHHLPDLFLRPPLVLAARAAWGASLPNGPRDLAAPGAPWERELTALTGHPGTSRALLSLGTADTLLPYPGPNRSWLHHVLFAPPGDWQATEEALSTERRAEVRGLLSRARELSDHPDPRLAIAMAGAALDRWERGRGLQSTALAPSPAGDALREQFRLHWLSQSRPGGLEDSLARFCP